MVVNHSLNKDVSIHRNIVSFILKNINRTLVGGLFMNYELLEEI